MRARRKSRFRLHWLPFVLSVAAAGGCGGGKSVRMGGSDGSSSGRTLALARFDVDVASGKVRITPGKSNSRSRAVFNGAALSFTSSDLLTVPGDSGQRKINISFTNNSGQTLGSNCRLVVGSLSDSSSISYKSATTVSTFAGSGTAGSSDNIGVAATFSGPTDIVAGQGPLAGSYFVADTANHVIRQLRQDGSVTTFAGTSGTSGSTDGPGTAARFSSPQQIACDANGNLFVADTGNNKVRIISPAGEVSTISGDGTTGNKDDETTPTALTADYNAPKGIAVSADGNRIYVADASNHSVRLITYIGTVRNSYLSYSAKTVIGNAQVDSTVRSPVSGFTDGYGTNSSGIAGGKVNNPVRLSLVIDSAGTEALYIADYNNHAIRRVEDPSLGGSSTSIYTAAGTGSAGSSDGSGATATLTNPNGLAYLPIDATHFGLFFTDEGTSHRLREIIANGSGSAPLSKASYSVNTLAGTGAAGFVDADGNTAQFSSPAGLCVIANGSGNSGGATLLLADKSNNRIRKINVAGTALKSGGTLSSVTEPVRLVNADSEVPNQTAWYKQLSLSQTADLQFYVPNGVAGFTFTVYVEGDSDLVNLPGNGNSYLSTLAGDGIVGNANGPGKLAEFNHPYGVVAVPSSLQGYYGTNPIRAFFTDTDNHRIRYIDTSGNIGTFAGSVAAGLPPGTDGAGATALFNRPFGIALHPDGSLFVSDTLDHSIRRVSTSGTVTTIAGSGSVGTSDGTSGANATLNTPDGITVDNGGMIYFTDYAAHTVRRIEYVSGDPSSATSYKVTTVAGTAGASGSTDGTGTGALFNAPSGIAADTDGAVYVVEQTGGRLRKLTRATATTMTSSTLLSSLNGPTGIAVDTAHNIYYSEYSGQKVSRIHVTALTPVVIMGSGSSGSADGASGTFFGPRELSVESGGNVLVTDYNNHRLRVIHRSVSSATNSTQ